MNWNYLLFYGLFSTLCAVVLAKCSEGAPPVGMFWLFGVAIGIGYAFGVLRTRHQYDEQIKEAIKRLTK